MYSFDELMMLRCLDLAAKGLAHVAPNPMVGSVLVHNGKVIGEGYHEQYGGPHAEVNCLQQVVSSQRHLIPEAHLYVSLEPCNHVGLTPACTSLIIQSKIKKVTIACRDSFGKVNGAGVAALKAAGIQVQEGVMANEARWLNRRFFTFHEKRRPYIILKWAQSAEGYMAPSDRQRVQLSNPQTQLLVHRWRADEAAILVGAATAIFDNPQLTVRHVAGKSPLRIVWDKALATPQSHHLLSDDGNTIVLNKKISEQRDNKLYVQVQEDDFITATLQLLYERNATSLIVEGGAQVLQSFIDAGMWDECRRINTATSLPAGIAAPMLKDALLFARQTIGDNLVDIFYHSQNDYGCKSLAMPIDRLCYF